MNSPLASTLRPETYFEHKSYKVHLTCELGQPVAQLLPENDRQHRALLFLRVEVSDRAGSQVLDALATSEDPAPLAAAMRPVINRIFRAVRNFGFVSGLEEFRTDLDLQEELITEWNPESSEDGNIWKPIFVTYRSPLFNALRKIAGPGSTDIREERWPFIEEAIQDDLDPGPEREFLTNSIQHLRKGNYRLALLEAVICLEIVLNEYLRLYLSHSRHLSNSRIKKVLNNQLGLTTRVGLVLEILLGKQEKQHADIEQVLRAINWRNEVVHKTGRLPSDMSEKSLSESIWATLELAQFLASRREDLASMPDAIAMANELSKAHGVDVEAVRFLAGHRITLRVQSRFDRNPLTDSEIYGIVADITARCAKRDPRFVPASHLFVTFTKGLLTRYATWANGKLERFPEPESALGILPPPPTSHGALL